MAGFKEYQMLFSLNANMNGNFNSTFQAGSNTIAQLQNQIESLNRTQGDISAYQKQEAALEKSRAKMQLYQQQLENLKNATASSSTEEAKLANDILAKEKQLKDATDAVDKNEAKLAEMGHALQEAGVDTNNLASETDRLKAEAAEAAAEQMKEAEAAEEAGQAFSEAMQGAKAALEAAGIVAGLKKIYDGLMDCSTAAAQFETAMAGVKRTVGGDDDFIEGLGESFKDLSTQMPITANELAAIATTAGQLGIAQDNVESFTTVMAKLATTTDLTADDAATMLAQFANITGVTDYERLGATIASLGDSTATTASKVVQMSQGMAAAANIAGMSETDILAISSAVGSLGIEAQAGSTAMSQLITTLYKATETGDKLEQFAEVAGMTGAQFKQAWQTDAARAFSSFISGLNDVERNGRSAVVILDELGITNVRQTKAILGLASAEGLLDTTISQANTAWSENTALTEKAGIMYNTTEAKMTMMQNAANNVQIAIGDALNPDLQAAYEGLTQLLQPLADFIEENPALVQGITAFVAVLGIATTAIIAYTAYTKLAAAASALFATSLPVIGIVVGVAAAIGGLVAGISALTSANKDATPSMEELHAEFDDLMSDIEKNNNIIKLADNYKTVSKQAKNLQSLMSGDLDQTVTFTPEAGGTLSQEDFGVSDQTIQYLASMDNTSYEEVQTKAEELRKQIFESSDEIAATKQSIAEAEAQAAALEKKISGTKNRKPKTQLQKQLDDVTESIENQKEKLGELETRHDDLLAEYQVVGTAAEELKGKEQELTAAKDALSAASDGVVDAANSEAEAFDEQAEAARKAAEEQRELARLTLFENLNQQSATYAKSVRDHATATDNLNSARQKEASLLSQINNYEDTNSAKLRTQYELTKALYAEWSKSPGAWTGGAMMSEELIESGTALQAMIKVLTGVNYTIEDLMNGQAAQKMEDWIVDLDELRTAYTRAGNEAQTYQQQIDDANDTQAKYIDSLTQAMLAGAITEDQLRTQLTDAFKDEADGAAIVEDIMNQVTSAYANATEAAEDYAEASEEVSDSQDDATRSVEDIVNDLKDLQTEYDEAYKSAYTSMSGQFKLFDDAQSKVSKMAQGYKGGIKQMTKNLESQQKYIENYQTNYELAAAKLAEAGVSAETAESILSGLSDGSVESGQALESIASGSTEDAQKLAEAYEKLGTAKETYSSTVAEMETNFSDTLTSLSEELSTTIEGMDMSTEAATNAKSTLDAYVNAADGYVALASAKYGAVAEAAVSALKKKFGLLGLFGGLFGFASGTESAPKGMALVGEEGPELVYFNGGETVVPADETARIAKENAEALQAEPANAASMKESAGGTYSINFSPQYNVESGVNADEVRAVLENNSANLREQLESLLAEITEDENRRSLA